MIARFEDSLLEFVTELYSKEAVFPCIIFADAIVVSCFYCYHIFCDK